MSENILSILLVEDNSAHVELIKRAFEDAGTACNITECNNINEAFQSIELSMPDLVLSDLNLPDGKGTDLIILENGKRNYPVILMTSFGDENIAVDAIKAGAQDYVVKSTDVFESMPKLIERALREWENITSREQAQQALLDKEAEQREILNSIMDAVITIDESSTILTFNKVAENLFGYSADELIGKSLSLLIPEEYRSRHKQAISDYIKTGKKHVIGVDGGIELEALRYNGEIFPVRLSIGELLDKNSKRRFIGICQDLTQLKQQEEQLRRSQKMDALGKLTGGIAHDFNNMLGIIWGYAELLESSLGKESELIDFVNEIFQASERGSKLTKKLLSFSRHTSSDTSVLNLNAVLHEQKHMLEKTLTARIELNFDLLEEDCFIEVNKSELVDAIVNMSINAMHAIDENGRLTIKTSMELFNQADASILQIEPGNYVLLSMKDTGCGMDAMTKEKIFEPFYTTKGEMGTGLGLSQVYGFVERSHGTIKVDSDVGTGSCLTLYFPCSVEVEEKHNHLLKDNNKTRDNLRGTETLLVVDDEASLRNLTSQIFIEYGYQVFSAKNGKQALEILEKEKIELLFSDVIMPEIDGFKLAAIVQKKYPSIKIQLASGFSDEHHIHMEDNTLYENLLTKPFSASSLLIKIRDLLDDK